MGRGVTVEETGHPEGGGGFGERGDLADSRVTPDLAPGGGGGYSMDVEIVCQTGEVGVRFVLEKSWNIGRVVYGMTERRLLELTGSNEQNPTFDLPCRDVFAKGQKAIEVVGPVEAVEVEAAKVHEGYWD